MLRQSSPETQLQLLGCFRMTTSEGSARLPMQAQRVLAYLAVSGSEIDRQDLSGRLWPYTGQSRAQGNLRTALWRIRQEAPDVLLGEGSAVALGGSVSVDYRSLLDPVNDLSQERPIDELLSQLRHDLLPGWDEEWLTIERERTRQLRMRRLESLSRECVMAGEIGKALSAAYAAIEVEPLRESAHLALVEAHLADGNRAEAVGQIRRMAAMFEDELGVGPSTAFQQHVEELGLRVPRGAG